MSAVEVFSGLASALNLATRLREIGANVKEAEFQNVLADLFYELGQAKVQASKVLEENAALRDQLTALRQHRTQSERVTVRDNACWLTVDDGSEQGPHCVACWSAHERLTPMQEQPDDNHWRCPVCRNNVLRPGRKIQIPEVVDDWDPFNR